MEKVFKFKNKKNLEGFLNRLKAQKEGQNEYLLYFYFGWGKELSLAWVEQKQKMLKLHIMPL